MSESSISSEYKLIKSPMNSNRHNSNNILLNKKKKRTRKKISWSEKEEKTLFILQMALGSKFSIIKTFLKDKSINDLKNHFYSKLRTYLSIQLNNLQQEKFFENIDVKKYNLSNVLSLVISSKTPTMILNKSVIKELILENEKKNEEKKDKNNVKEKKVGKKRGRPRKNDNKDKDKTISEKENKISNTNVNIQSNNNNNKKIMIKLDEN